MIVEAYNVACKSNSSYAEIGRSYARRRALALFILSLAPSYLLLLIFLLFYLFIVIVLLVL